MQVPHAGASSRKPMSLLFQLVCSARTQAALHAAGLNAARQSPDAKTGLMQADMPGAGEAAPASRPAAPAAAPAPSQQPMGSPGSPPAPMAPSRKAGSADVPYLVSAIAHAVIPHVLQLWQAAP